jgi:hypothetical protein
MIYRGLFLLLFIASSVAQAQKFDLFEIENNELTWRYTYDYQGPKDSLRSEVVSMIKSKIFTRNVERTEIGNSGVGYYGEIQHYKVDCKRYGRKYQNTPLIYWSGEWSGKFAVEVRDNSYRVTIYGLYFENQRQTQSSPHQNKTPRKGFYVNEVWDEGYPNFKKNVSEDMILMSMSLRDAFDIKKYVTPIKDW